MRSRPSRLILGIVASGVMLAAGARGQTMLGSQSVLSESSATTSGTTPSTTAAPSIEALPPGAEAGSAPSPTAAAPSIVGVKTVKPPDASESETLVDPASLLPDLPKLPPAKASLIGGNIGRLDRVRDEITVQVFGGGKMKISFDPRTRFYRDGTEARLSDLRQGDRIYIDTILDGSTVFARAIRVKTSGSSGESQGIITSYRADKGELQMRDALSPQTIKIHVTPQTQVLEGGHTVSSPQTIKIHVTPQTQVLEGGHTVSSSALLPGTLVAVKFGARQEGGEVAREVSLLARPGASFTFAGQVTAIDLRLGLLVLTSSTDRKTYEIYLDPSVRVDDSIQPNTNVTVLTRFEGNRYVARSVTVNSQNQQ